jgi:hypothetical protein
MDKDLLRIKWIIFLVLLVLFQVIITLFVNYVYSTENVFYNTFADQLTYDKINEAFKTQTKYQWIGYVFLPILFVIKILYNSAWLTTGSLLNTERGNFKANFNICLKAEYVFVAMLIVKFALLVFVKEVNTLNDLNFVPLSLANLLNVDKIPKWAIYPLQTINIWELWFCWVGTSLYSRQFNISKAKAAALFCIPYLTGLFIWVLVVVFITLQLT